MDRKKLNAAQFGNVAQEYLHSPVHAQGADLDRLRTMAQEYRPEAVLDLGCGAGHASFAVAPYAETITAYDPLESMLEQVEAEAKHRGYHNIGVKTGPAERLPYTDAEFDWVISRYSAHHWADVPKALTEISRVLKPDGLIVLIDSAAPEVPALDTLINAVEILRDRSHVRNYRLSEWTTMLTRAGLQITLHERWQVRVDFNSWVARTRTPEVRVKAIIDLIEGAATEAREHFQFEDDHSFQLETVGITAVK
jgi:ubiquinone/menaquinone biosynthesis C-methylase UbiE